MGLNLVNKLSADLLEFFGGEGEVAAVSPSFVEGFEVDVGVGNVGADDFPDDAAAGFGFEVAAEFFGGFHEGGEVLFGEVVDFVNLELGDDESVAFDLGVNVEEGEGFGVFVDFVAGDVAADDLGEDAGGLVVGSVWGF